MSYYKKHLFFCTNIKKPGKKCCGQEGLAAECARYAKSRLKALGLHGFGAVRVSSSGCLGRCGCGPLLVIYPEGVWYRYRNQADIDRIIEQHIVKGNIIDDLLIKNKE